jgi:hypothetical protein
VLDFEINSRSRKCSATDRPFEPGETFYSALVSEGGSVVRYDYAKSAWQGPPERCIGWWKSVVPDARGGKTHWAPNDVMLHYFEQIAENPEKQDVRYVLTLLMIRRRVLRLEEKEGSPGELVVFCPKNEQTYHVAIADPPSERIDAIQNELAELLFGT